MEEKKIENERDENTYRLKNEERTKNGEERRKIFTDLLSEALRKHFDSIFLHENVFFYPK